MNYQKIVETVYQRVTDKLIEWNESVYFRRLYKQNIDSLIMSEKANFWNCNFMSTFSHHFNGNVVTGNYSVPLRTTLVNSILQARAEMIKK